MRRAPQRRLLADNHRSLSCGEIRPAKHPRLLGEGQEGAYRDDRRGVSLDSVRARNLERVVMAGGEDFVQWVTRNGELHGYAWPGADRLQSKT